VPPGLGERLHRGFARGLIAVRRRAVLVVPEGERPHPGRSGAILVPHGMLAYEQVDPQAKHIHHYLVWRSPHPPQRIDTPFPKLKKGEQLCMSSLAPADPFYAQCRKCERRVSECTGDLRDRIRRSPYLR
jgi:hypothetical protein